MFLKGHNSVVAFIFKHTDANFGAFCDCVSFYNLRSSHTFYSLKNLLWIFWACLNPRPDAVPGFGKSAKNFSSKCTIDFRQTFTFVERGVEEEKKKKKGGKGNTSS